MTGAADHRAASAGKRASPGAGHPAGLILAAGEGRRFGRPKALVEIDGERFVDRAIRLLAEGGCAPLVVVSGATAVGDLAPDVVTVHNSAWAEGMGTSLRAGLAALDSYPVDVVVVALVDQPWLGPEAVRRLLTARSGGAAVAVATYDGRRGNPVLLGREVWPGVAALAQGDVGARAFMAANPGLVTEVPCDGTGSPDDIDHPDDLLDAQP